MSNTSGFYTGAVKMSLKPFTIHVKLILATISAFTSPYVPVASKNRSSKGKTRFTNALQECVSLYRYKHAYVIYTGVPMLYVMT